MLSALKNQFRAWLFRPKIESGTVTLDQRRIFILPTRRGLGFALVLVLMLLGDINYNLSLGYVLTFLLATLAVLSMLHAFRNMIRLEIRSGHSAEVFAGGTAHFLFHVYNSSAVPRYQLVLHDTQSHRTVFDVAAQQSVEVKLSVPVARRGWLNSGRLTLHTEFPLGLFHAWSYLHFDTRVLVYPRPAAPLPLPFSAAHDAAGISRGAGDDDFAGLRSYVAGDALPRIAWKALAREQGLQVKQFSAQLGQQQWLDWAALPNISVEQKLAVLTRWVIDADALEVRYGLRIPGSEIAPQHNPAHRAQCLRALALFNLPQHDLHARQAGMREP